MAASDNRARFESRMHKVLERIDQSLDQSLDLETLADVAHFSPYHFHRLFSAWMGETLGDYLRRRRLEIAGMRLAAQPRVPVLDVALSVGFGSTEAFAHAFRSRFGCSPTAWRRQQAAQRRTNRNPDQLVRKMNQDSPAGLPNHEASRNPPMEAFMNVRLVDRQPTNVAYLRYQGPYGAPLSRFWQEKVYPWLATNNLLDQPRYGVSHDDPNITAPGQCRYDACVRVPQEFVLLGNAFKTTLPGGKYAVMPFNGTVADIEKAWTALLRDWLPSSGLQLDARPCLEHYPRGSGFNAATGVFDCEICIPVVPL